MYQRLLLCESYNQILEGAIAERPLQEISGLARRHRERLAIPATSLCRLRFAKHVFHALLCGSRQLITRKWLRPEPVYDLFLPLPGLLDGRYSNTSLQCGIQFDGAAHCSRSLQRLYHRNNVLTRYFYENCVT